MKLKRELGVLDATMLGLGSILGTGVFLSIGIAAGIAGSSVIIATAIAAMVATCNALSSAQLAASHPVSGGTYEYGYRYLNPTFGFVAGWMFLFAKSASAATAALGFAGYLLTLTGQDSRFLVPLAIGTVIMMTFVVLSGIRRSNWVNIGIVFVTILSLLAFLISGSSQVTQNNLAIDFEPRSLLYASALMFVAFAGYGRIATLGEEVLDPKRTIPRAIITTLVISMLLYIGVAIVAVGTVGADQLHAATGEKAAPLATVAQGFPWNVHWLVAVGAMTAMLGVLLNLIQGLSRVLFAMGRRGDMPSPTGKLNIAILAIGGLVGGLTAIGNIQTTWTFSAFAVLIYYAITNLAALQIDKEERLYSKAWAWVGLVACLSLAFAIEPSVWAIGLGLLAVGIVWQKLGSRLAT